MRGSAGLFISQIWRAPRAVGAALPSSRGLAREMVAPIDFGKVRTIVEFGPGTGAFTGEIAARLASGARYVGIELNGEFCAHVRRQFPALDVVEDSVENLERILDERDIASVDAIVCGLPWASLPLPVQERAFAAIERRLAPGGLFMTFAYLQGLPFPGARALRRRLSESFSSVTRSRIVWANVPPAFVYICRK